MKLDRYWETFWVSGKISDYLDCKKLHQMEALNLQTGKSELGMKNLNLQNEMKQEMILEKKSYMVESDAGFC